VWIKNYKKQTVSREKLAKALLYKKLLKILIKLTLVRREKLQKHFHTKKAALVK